MVFCYRSHKKLVEPLFKEDIPLYLICAKLLLWCPTLCNLWTVARRTHLSMGFSCPTQGLNLYLRHLLHCRQVLNLLSYLGNNTVNSFPFTLYLVLFVLSIWILCLLVTKIPSCENLPVFSYTIKNNQEKKVESLKELQKIIIWM